MRWIGLAVVFAYGIAHGDSQLATDDVPAATLASPAVCKRLVGHEPRVVAAIMKERKLRPITLDRIVLPSNVAVAAVAPQLMVTVDVGGKKLRGIASNVAGDGCIQPDIRHGIDADGNLYQIDGPPHVVDYTKGTCHTARGWEPCNLRGVTNVLFVVADPKATLAGIVGSDLKWYAARRW
jgi:hypothetical protein